MALFKGTELTRTTLDEPAKTLRSILVRLKRLLRDARLVHGDLSEYNILISESGQFVFIDWPQSVSADDPRADHLLTRDVSNILRFFAKRYRTSVPPKDALDFVRSKKKRLIQ